MSCKLDGDDYEYTDTEIAMARAVTIYNNTNIQHKIALDPTYLAFILNAYIVDVEQGDEDAEEFIVLHLGEGVTIEQTSTGEYTMTFDSDSETRLGSLKFSTGDKLLGDYDSRWSLNTDTYYRVYLDLSSAGYSSTLSIRVALDDYYIKNEASADNPGSWIINTDGFESRYHSAPAGLSVVDSEWHISYTLNQSNTGGSYDDITDTYMYFYLECGPQSGLKTLFSDTQTYKYQVSHSFTAACSTTVPAEGSTSEITLYEEGEEEDSTYGNTVEVTWYSSSATVTCSDMYYFVMGSLAFEIE